MDAGVATVAVDLERTSERQQSVTAAVKPSPVRRQSSIYDLPLDQRSASSRVHASDDHDTASHATVLSITR